MPGAEREPPVHQHRAQILLGYSGLENQQRAQLRVAVLLDHETDVVAVQEGFDIGIKREAAYPHVVGAHAPSGQIVECLPDRQVAAAKGDDSDAVSLIPYHRRRDELRRCCVLAGQPVDYLPILVRDLGIAAEFVVAGAAGEERALRMDTWQRPGGHVVLVLG